MTAEQIHKAWDWQSEANLRLEKMEARIKRLENNVDLLNESVARLLRLAHVTKP